MTDEVGWAELGVRPDVDGFGTSLDRKLGPQLDKAGRSGGRLFGASFGKVAAGIGALAIGSQLIDLGKDSYSAAKEAEKGQRLTAQLIKQTGGVAKVTTRDVDRLTSSLMKKNAVDDDIVRQSANILLTFKAVSNAGKGMNAVFDRAVAASQDIASIEGMGGATGAAKMLGKALTDPVAGLTALKKAGVDFTEQQKLEIKTLAESGEILKARKLVLNEVESQTKGAAKAQADAGDRIGVAWGELQETLGENFVVPGIDWLAEKGIPKLEDFSGWIESDGVPALKKFGDEAQPLAKEILPAIGTTVGTIGDGLKFAAPYARDLVGAFNDMPDWAKAAFVAGGVGAFAVGKLKPGKSGGIFGAISEAKPLPVWVVNKAGGLGLDPGLDGGKGKKGGKLPFLAGASPLLLPLLTSGDSAPKEPMPKLEQAYGKLLIATGAKSKYEFEAALFSANDTTVKKWKETLSKLGVSLRDIEKADFNWTKDLDGWAAQRKASRAALRDAAKGDGTGTRAVNLDPMFAATLNDKQINYIGKLPKQAQIEVSTPGLVDSRKDVIDLTKRVDGLDRKDVRPLIKLLGIETAETRVDRLTAKLEALGSVASAGLNAIAYQGLGAPGGINVNVGTMNVADGRDMTKQADRKRRRAQLDGVRSSW